MPTHLNHNEMLLKNLPQFGLDPKDWRLHKVNSKNYIIKNREDEEICLWGQIEDEKASDWQELQWLSI